MDSEKRVKHPHAVAGGRRLRTLTPADLPAGNDGSAPSLVTLCALDILTRITDVEGHVLHLNPAAVRISGSSPDLARGRHIADLLYTPLNTELRDQRALLESARHQGHATVRLAIPITTYRGEMQLIDYHATPLTDDDGALIGGLFIASDFHQRDEAVEETG